MRIFLLVLVGCWALLGIEGQFAARYDGFRIYRVYVKDDEQLKEFKNLGDKLPLRLLKEIGGSGGTYDIAIDPSNQNKLESEMSFLELEYSCVIEDLQTLLDEEQPQSTNLHHSIAEMDWTKYHNLTVIYNWLHKLTSRHRKIIKPYIIGYSYEGRPIKAVKISFKTGNKAIFIESNIHAIERIGSATTTCFFDRLLNSKDEKMRYLLENNDWIYVPVGNPDGFEYTFNNERLWRKNRKPTGFYNESGACYGTDLNRNFDYHWGMKNVYNIDVPCDHWYGGDKPANQPEVQALQKFVTSFKPGYISMYLAFHSYGNFVLLPYGHTTDEFPPNYKQMLRIGEAFAKGAREKYGTEFVTGASDPVSGSAKDWAYGVAKIPFTATIELRDKGKYGFFLPASQIIEVCDEVTDGMIAMVAKAKEEKLSD